MRKYNDKNSRHWIKLRFIFNSLQITLTKPTEDFDVGT